MKFTKMHGLGNDYVYVNGFVEDVKDVNTTARKLADRHFGVGGDGMILILPPTSKDVGADVRMRMFNNDGSEGEMCGNGIRCVAKYSYDHGLSKNNPLRVETGRGVLSIALTVDAGKVTHATVDMDEPILELDRIPMKQGGGGHNAHFLKKAEHEYAISYEIDGKPVVLTPVSMGNPHVVVFVEDVDAVNLESHGPKLEAHPAFPKKTNVHFAQVINRGELKMRTWERGSGITLACGTGACSVNVAAVLTGRSDRKTLIHLPGGDLSIEWNADNNRVFMTGPATEVFSGEIVDS
jgi:diaminopimelate epimerase